MRHLAGFLFLLLAPAALTAQTEAGDTDPLGRAGVRTARAARAVEAPVLDGRDTDPAWHAAPVIDRFLEYEPDEGAETRFRTEARVTYDDRNLYLLVRMYDPAPDSMVALLSRRDVRTNSEQVKVVIDSYHDRRTAYQFAVNPVGVKRDFYVYSDNVEDPSWDAVWDVATTMDSLGWTAEFRIPFSQLRFAELDEHTFGLMIVRDVARTGERISWPLYRRNVQGYVSQAGEISGITGISSPRRLEMTPYVVAKNETVQEPLDFDRAQRFTGGLDLKYGVTSNLTLDATVNPDFGQVESDPAVLNLSTVETRREERRPFFLEGTGIFSFPVYCDDVDWGCRGLFHSRRIGRSPQLRQFGDERSPTATTILGAAKLTGRFASGLSIGVVDAVTEREAGTLGRPIEPRTNYFAARVQQDLGRGNTGIGAMVTGVHRSLDEHSAPLLVREAYAGGIDLRHRFWSGNYQLTASATVSRVSGSAEAIAATQNSFVHAYQRPDDDVELDPTRTSLAGSAQRITFAKFGGGRWRFETVYQRFSPGLELNDLGFLPRADEQLHRNWFAIQLNEPTRWYRRANLNFNLWQSWTAGGMRKHFGTNVNWHVQLPNQFWVHVGGNANELVPTFDDREARGGPAVRRSPYYETWGGVEGDQRWLLIPYLFGGRWTTDEGDSRGWWLEPSLDIRASSRFMMSIGPRWSHTIDDSQWVENFGDIGHDTTHYTFARMDQTTVSLTTRIDYTHSPTLSFQFYAQPFISAVEYSDWRELANARAEDYAARYQPYDGGDPGGLDVKELRTNAVVRWEYRPGSALFVVWSQGREQFLRRASTFRFRDDTGDLFGLHPDNTFLIKLSYWINP